MPKHTHKRHHKKASKKASSSSSSSSSCENQCPKTETFKIVNCKNDKCGKTLTGSGLVYLNDMLIGLLNDGVFIAVDPPAPSTELAAAKKKKKKMPKKKAAKKAVGA